VTLGRRKSRLAAAEEVCRIAEIYDVWANKPPWESGPMEADKFNAAVHKAVKEWKRARSRRRRPHD
jgi:hypothetical protein